MHTLLDLHAKIPTFIGITHGWSFFIFQAPPTPPGSAGGLGPDVSRDRDASRDREGAVPVPQS